MEIKSSKQEILQDLKSLKEKGVQVIMNDSCVVRGGNIFMAGSCHGSLILPPSEIKINIYLNSTEDEIINQISTAKYQVESYENSAKTSAIVEFLRDELK